jgi:hypothetical protein
MRHRWLSALALLAGACAVSPARELEESLSALRAVGAEGEGHAAAAEAWRSVVARGPDALLPVLGAFDGATPRAANWLRSAADAIAERTLLDRQPLDAAGLEAFVRETRQDGAARYLAYEWLVRVDATATSRLLPGMLDDPGQELRRDAVARATTEAEKVMKGGDRTAAAQAYRKVFDHARDRDQVDALAKILKGLGVEADVQVHYGVIPRWTILTTFDNTEMKGFDVAYPPEKRVDLKAELEGKGGRRVRVVECSTADPHGKVDLNETLGKEMGAVAYAFASVEALSARPVEVRVGTNNAVKIFLNGEPVFFRNEYHHGMKMDQYVGRGRLRPGRNEILLKICQNEQKEDWAQGWSFQGRICDALGTAVPVRLVGGSR